MNEFQTDAVKALVEANIPVTAFGRLKGFIQKYCRPGLSLGNLTDLIYTYWKVVHTKHLDQLCYILSKSGVSFRIIMDGTPSFAEAECIMVRLVTKDIRILIL